MALGPGARFETYEILKPIGSGGMGEVWLARDVRLDREVALKFLQGDLTSDAERAQRFRREALAASALNHPNVCTIHALGETPDGRAFIAMEYVKGLRLRERLASERLALRDAIEIAAQIASALAAAHARNIVHRDIKPENVMLRQDGLVKVLDFGVAKLLATRGEEAESASTHTCLTRPGTVAGTVAYMSPEQARAEEVDARSDIWSLGVLLYEMVTGRRPFEGTNSGDLLVAILHHDPLPLARLEPHAPRELQRIIAKALHKNRDERYQSVRDLLLDLRALTHVLGEPTTGDHLTSSDHGAPRSLRARASHRRWSVTRRGRLLGAGLGALVLVGAWLVAADVGGIRDRLRGSAAHPQVGSLAVLPLENLSGNRDEEYLSDGMTEALINELAQLGGIRVISRTSAMQFKGVRRSLPVIGRELNVDAVVEGSVRRSDRRVAITVRLIQASTDRQLWAQNYERDLQNVLELHRDVARAIASEIRLRLSPEDQARLLRITPVDPEVYEQYMRGRYYLNIRHEASLLTAIEHFERAIQRDPAYAPAYSGLADAHTELGYAFGRVPPTEAMPKAKRAARRALELDPKLAEGHTSLGIVTFFYDWDWASAERELQEAIRLNPNYARAHHGYAGLLTALRRPQEAVGQAQRALEIDPLSLPVNNILGSMLTIAGRYDEAIERYRRLLELDPKFVLARTGLGSAYQAKGMDAEALEEFLQAKTMSGESADVVAALRRAYQQSGWRGYGEKELEIAKARWNGWHTDAFVIARLAANAGRKDETLEWLERVYRARSGTIIWLPSNRRLNALLKDDARYHDLLRRMNLLPPDA